MNVINFWGAPGSGKSTTAAGLFFLMKNDGHSVELVTEYAKELTYEKHHNLLSDQLYILAEQNRRLERLKNQVQYVITDSPLLLSSVYATDDYLPLFKAFNKALFDSYSNLNFLVKRVKPYNPVGRNQNELESDAVGEKIRAMLIDNRVQFNEVFGDRQAPQKALDLVLTKI